MTALTLNKITSQRGISVGEAAKKIADLGWNPSYVQEAMTFPTDYKIAKAPRDPMKQVLRSYFPMQEEKDNRVYGALDAALRGDMFRNVEPRWVEWMKLFLAIIPFPEISAARSMAMVARLAPGEDLRTGFTMQMVDEFRHSTIQMNLKKWYMENYIDPAGFDITEEAFGKCYATTIGRQFGEGFITGDAITSANIYLTVVAETAFTNTLFVAMPSEAARNGDYALPTVFLSVQSDESRHIGNGHSLLMATLKDPDNHLLLERDLKLRVLAEPRDRRCRHRHLHRVRHDQPRQGQGVLRGDVAPLDLRGLLPHLHAAAREVRHQDPPRRRPGGVEAASPRRTTSTRSASSSRSAGRSTSGGSRPRPTRTSSGSSRSIRAGTREFGDFWKWYAKLSHKGETVITFNQDVGYVYPHRCWSCLVPCLIREDMVVDEIDGKLHTFAHELDRWTAVEAFADEYQGRPTPAMGRFSGKREWETLYHGWDLADAIKDLNFVRSDGKTLIPQPHLRFDDKEMWTLDDVRGPLMGDLNYAPLAKTCATWCARCSRSRATPGRSVPE